MNRLIRIADWPFTIKLGLAPAVAVALMILLAVTGLTHRTSYRDIFAVTLIKTAAVFVVIAVYYITPR